ncbi:MAG TPA: hypothetical protein PKC60_07015 [Hydrogenophaga sp.]|uniref:hypothetical protein n=1 Tax=Hydrogenophaga sp. TaxID=1904254 RepID=UPI002CA3FB16|nr:hypothetical protein [Hydrogenophaga sp.]HMN92964.1 hypothetical protein [Hydrogenophaga sp.]HMP09732.1 hypothetical protein [Hydrogenophaga sp.]
MQLVISDETQAWEALRKATRGGGFPDDVQLVLNGWPVFKMDIKGRDWDSTVPTRIMSPLLDVQKDINRAYANVRYGADSLRKLRDEERDDLEVVVKVKKGSSIYDADLWKQLTAIGEAAVGRMNGTEIVITVLGLGLLLTAPVMYKAWLAARQQEKQLEHQLSLSQQETERMQIFSDAMQKQPVLEATKQDVIATQNRMLKATRPGDVMAVHSVPVGADEAAVLVQTERERSEDVVVDDAFVVLGNRTDRIEGFRITVRRLSDGLVLQADVPIELPYPQQQLVQKAEWEKEKIHLTMNASSLRGKLSQAVVISAREVSA